MISIFVAESSDGVREALLEMISETDGVELAGVAGDACGAIEGYLERAQQHALPQVLIIDIQLVDGSGLGVLQFIKRRFPLTKVIMLCDCISAVYRERCASQGADYFFDKVTEFGRVQEILSGLARAGKTSNLNIAA